MEKTVPLPAINASVDLTLRGSLIDRMFVEWRHDERTDTYGAYVLGSRNGGEFVEARVDGYGGCDGGSEWLSIEGRKVFAAGSAGPRVEDYEGLAEELASEALGRPGAYLHYRSHVEGYPDDELNFASKSSAFDASFWEDCPDFIKETKPPKASGYEKCVEFMESYLSRIESKDDLAVSLEGGVELSLRMHWDDCDDSFAMALENIPAAALREWLAKRDASLIEQAVAAKENAPSKKPRRI